MSCFLLEKKNWSEMGMGQKWVITPIIRRPSRLQGGGRQRRDYTQQVSTNSWKLKASYKSKHDIGRRKQAARCKKKANCKSKQELWKKCKRKKPASKMQEESKQQKQARYGKRRQAARARSEQARRRRRSKQVSTNSWQQAPRARQHMEEANDGVLVWQDAFWRPGTCILQLVCCWCQKQCLDAWQLNFEAKKRNEKVSGKRKKAAQEGCGGRSVLHSLACCFSVATYVLQRWMAACPTSMDRKQCRHGRLAATGQVSLW